MSVSFRAAKTARNPVACAALFALRRGIPRCLRSEEHTSELQSRLHLVCRLLLEKKNISEVRSAPGAAACPVSPTAFAASRGYRVLLSRAPRSAMAAIVRCAVTYCVVRRMTSDEL